MKRRELDRALTIFAEGLSLAEAELAGMEKDQRPESRAEDSDQPGLFDTKGPGCRLQCPIGESAMTVKV